MYTALEFAKKMKDADSQNSEETEAQSELQWTK